MISTSPRAVGIHPVGLRFKMNFRTSGPRETQNVRKHRAKHCNNMKRNRSQEKHDTKLLDPSPKCQTAKSAIPKTCCVQITIQRKSKSISNASNLSVFAQQLYNLKLRKCTVMQRFLATMKTSEGKKEPEQ